ncbi:MAG: hypothetical protein ALECFALPRED_002910 [Alectoria fallacina]|uniref:Uncharacterized protein n=1 Tax=Alectoria fallacina TaxID=1903189 RepID=A0A8H3FH64_9LECA|nr:MAG: hypothetical protein ALECFALPRED_002910 [Alectoria fallacina]
MSSLAVRSRIPVHVNDSVVPTAASLVHVNDSVVPTAASLVHVNDSVVPAAASHPSVNTVDDIVTIYSAMSIDEPTTVKPTSASPSTSHASKSKLTVAAATSAFKGCPPLRQRQQRSLANVAPSVNSASVLDRIAKRRQRVVANLASGSNRPTPPVKVTPTSILKSSPAVAAIPKAVIPAAAAVPEAVIPATAVVEAVVPAVIAIPDVVIPAVAAVPEVVVPIAAPAPRRYRSLMYQMPANFRQDKDGKCHFIDRLVQISDQVWDSDCLIPSASTSRKPRARLPGRFRPATVPLTRTHIANRISPVLLPLTMSYFPRHFPPVYLTRRPESTRGCSPYCPARPHLPDRYINELGYGPLPKGRTCECCEDDGEIPLECFNIPPGQWETTPAESGVDTNPPIVRTDRPRKKVRFAEDLIDTFQVLKDPRGVFKSEPKSKDTSPRAKDFPEGFPFMLRRKILGRR